MGGTVRGIGGLATETRGHVGGMHGNTVAPEQAQADKHARQHKAASTVDIIKRHCPDGGHPAWLEDHLPEIHCVWHALSCFGTGPEGRNTKCMSCSRQIDGTC